MTPDTSSLIDKTRNIVSPNNKIFETTVSSAYSSFPQGPSSFCCGIRGNIKHPSCSSSPLSQEKKDEGKVRHTEGERKAIRRVQLDDYALPFLTATYFVLSLSLLTPRLSFKKTTAMQVLICRAPERINLKS